MPLIRGVVNLWAKLWDFEVSPNAYRRLRAGVGLLFVAVFLGLFDHATLLFDARTGLPPELVRGTVGGVHLPFFDTMTGWQVSAVLFAGTVCAGLFALSIWPRRFGVVVYVIHLGLQYRSGWWMDGSDDLLRAMLFFLLFAPSPGAAERVPGWPIRLVQIQLVLMYVSTAIWKLSGTDWRRGDALYWALSDPRWQRFPTDWLVTTTGGQALTTAATWATLAVEIVLPLLLVLPRTRRVGLALGVALHVGIFLTMRIGLFTPAVLVAYLGFCYGPSVRDRS